MLYKYQLNLLCEKGEFKGEFNCGFARFLKGHCHHILSYFLIPFYFERNLTKTVSQGIINRNLNIILKINKDGYD